MCNSLRDRTGFTLVELMIVVAIIGVLAAIAIPNFMQYRAKSRQAEAKTNLGGVFVSEVSYFSEQSRFGSFAEIGFAVPGTSNRYSYRSPANGGAAGCSATGATATNCYIPAQTGTGGQGADNSLVPSGANATTGSVGFTATAVSDLDNDATLDQWHVNDIKQNLQSADSDDILG